MSYVNLVHLKPLLMLLTAVAGSAGTGVMVTQIAGAPHAIGSFAVSLNPSSVTLVENATSTSTVSVISFNGYTGTVALTVSYLTPHITVSLSPTSVILLPNSVAKAALTLTAPSTTGNYTVLVVGISTSHHRTTYSSAMLTVQVVSSQDFTITATPNVITSPTGSANTTMITVTSVHGYSGNVSLTFTAPFGLIEVVGGISPLKIVSGGTESSPMTITTSVSTTPGTYTVTVTGTSGTRSHSTTITLIVADPTPPPVIVEGLSLTSHTFNNVTMLTMVFQNTGNGSLTITSYVVRDSFGDAFSLTNYAGPTIPVNSAGTAVILIGSSCPTCTYTGITGLFTQFQLEHTYTVTVTTARNNQFTFTVSY